jgi:hypothetical protein
MAKTKLVEPGLYAGRKSFGGGPDGLGKRDPDCQFPADEINQPLKRNSGDVPDDRRASAGAHGLNPNFDSDAPRKAPKLGGGSGSDTQKSPFSAAHNVSKD